MVTSCPFCGLGTDLPHETQQACIAALHAEIARMRQVVDRLNVLNDVPLSGDSPNAQPGAEDR
jgi:nitrogen-specific signal transduction histidine kinase